MEAPRYKALLLLLIFDVVIKNCSCFHNFRQRPCYLNWRLKCAEAGPTSIPSSKRSSMNEKMLERAKILREEASALESPKDSPVFANTTDLQVEDGGIKILRDEFVSRFPVERLTANTSIFTLGAFETKDVAASSTSTEYTSVLVERDAEQKKQKLQLDKISGEATRKKSIATPSIQDMSKIIDIAISQLSEPQPILESTRMDASALVGEIDYSNITSIFSALNSLSDSTQRMNISSIENALVKTVDSNNNVVYELQDVDKYLKIYLNWAQREAFKLWTWMLYVAVDKDAIENKSDFKFLEIAFISYLLDLANSAGAEGEQELFDDLIGSYKSGNYHLRADFLKAMVTRSVPSIAEMERLVASENDAIVKEDDITMQPQMALWRVSTLKRLKSTDPSAVKQREIMWGITNETYPVTDTVESVKVLTPSPVLKDAALAGEIFAAEPLVAYQVRGNVV